MIALLLPGLAFRSGGASHPPSIPLVVIIDSGIANDHPDFRDRFLAIDSISRHLPESVGGGVGRYWVGWDFVESDAEPQDQAGHGTHVAGLVARELGPVSEGSPRLAMFRTGDLKHELAPVTAALEAVVVLRKAGFDIPVVLCAFDYRKTDEDGVAYDRFADALRKVLDSGAICVCAAGNSGLDLDADPDGRMHYQVALRHPAMITVAACSNEGQLLANSNYGARSVALAAPGLAAISAAREGGQTALSGSSQAAASVAGRLARHAATSKQREVNRLRDWLLSQVRTEPSLLGRITSAGFLPLEREAVHPGD